jgi:hypothetical protein
MSLDTGDAVVFLYYFFITMTVAVFVTGMVAVLHYVVRGSRAIIHYAARRWWRW